MELEPDRADSPLSKDSGGSDEFNQRELRHTMKPSVPPRPPKEELNVGNNPHLRRKDSPRSNFQSIQVEPVSNPPQTVLTVSLNTNPSVPRSPLTRTKSNKQIENSEEDAHKSISAQDMKVYEEEINQQYRIAEETKNVMKEVQRKINKFQQSIDQTSADALSLVDTMKKLAFQLEKANSDEKDLAQAMGKTAELIRFIESLRSNLANKDDVMRKIEPSMNTFKRAKKKYEDLSIANNNASKVVYHSMRKEKVNLVKASEQRQEMDQLQKKLEKLAPETAHMFKVGNEQMTVDSLDKVVSLMEYYRELFENGIKVIDAVSPDIKILREKCEQRREALNTDMKFWNGIQGNEEHNEVAEPNEISETDSLDINLESEPDARLAIMKATVNEEKSYTKYIKLILIYKQEMLKDTTLFVEITKEDVTTIFSNMDVIFSTHNNFLEQLEDCVQNWSTKKVNVSNIFMEVVHSSPHYMHYISTLSDALTTVHNASLKAKFPNFLKACAMKSHCDLELQDLLSLPCKQISKYNRILEKLVSVTSMDSDHSQLMSCKEKFADFSGIVTLGYTKAMSKYIYIALIDFSRNQKDDLPSEWFERSFVFEGFLLLSVPLPPVENKNNNAVPMKPEVPQQQEIYCFLFNDCIVFTRHSEKKGNYKFISKYSLSVIKLQSLDESEGNKMEYFSISIYPTTPQQHSQPTNIFILSCNSQPDKEMWMKQILDTKSELERSKVFGVSLEDLMSSQNERGRDIPSFIENAIQFLSEQALKEEGLFRLSGSAKDMQALTDAINSRAEVNMQGKDYNAIAGLVKQFLRSLPEPIFSWQLTPKVFFDTLKIEDKEERIQNLRKCMEELPHYNQCLSQYIFKFLNAVHSNAAVNKMMSSNIAIVFAPLLYRQKEVNPDSPTMIDYQQFSPVIQLLIEEYSQIFYEIEAQILIANEERKREREEKKKERRKGAMFGKENLEEQEEPPEMLSDDEEGPVVIPTKILSLGEIVKQGFLSKQGFNIKSWRVRWFVLKKQYLYYFGNRKDATPKGVIELRNVEIALYSKREFCFSIEARGREYLIASKSQKDMMEWMEAIKTCSVVGPVEEGDEEREERKQNPARKITNLVGNKILSLAQRKQSKSSNKPPEEFNN